MEILRAGPIIASAGWASLRSLPFEISLSDLTRTDRGVDLSWIPALIHLLSLAGIEDRHRVGEIRTGYLEGKRKIDLIRFLSYPDHLKW